jgi:hypothetical protein
MPTCHAEDLVDLLDVDVAEVVPVPAATAGDLERGVAVGDQDVVEDAVLGHVDRGRPPGDVDVAEDAVAVRVQRRAS